MCTVHLQTCLQEDERWWNAIVLIVPANFEGEYVVEWTDPGVYAKTSSVVQESIARSANPVEAAEALQVKIGGVKTKAAEGKAAKVQSLILWIGLIAVCAGGWHSVGCNPVGRAARVEFSSRATVQGRARHFRCLRVLT